MHYQRLSALRWAGIPCGGVVCFVLYSKEIATPCFTRLAMTGFFIFRLPERGLNGFK
ncbi:MAG: hypothetical protein IKN18_02360 [Neisseriaceae bacterium]|nr:hypothetical protein [Neisseriaceae bacterium]